MAKMRITARVSDPADEIVCAKCGCPSFERGSETDTTLGNDRLLVTFECATCGHVETRGIATKDKSKNGRGRAG